MSTRTVTDHVVTDHVVTDHDHVRQFYCPKRSVRGKKEDTINVTRINK